MKIRLSFAEVPDPDIEFWSNRLRSRGIDVTSATESGIDAEGAAEAIERALDTKIDLSDESKPVIGEVKLTEKPGKPPPLAYVPRKPTFFA